jgi:hypothetical protein
MPVVLWNPSRQSLLTSLPWRRVRWEPLLCVPVGVLDWRQSVVVGPSSFQFPAVTSPARWLQSGAWLVQSRVLHVLVLDSSLLLLSVAAACQADSFDPPATRMWRLFLVVLDATSSRFRPRGTDSWVCARLLDCVMELSCLFPFFFFLFPLCLS